MTIKEVEQQTGLNRSNIRFYEKERLIEPERNASNGYRDYSAEDVDTLKKIAYLRTLEISIEDIRKIQSGEEPLKAVLEKQIHIIGIHIDLRYYSDSILNYTYYLFFCILHIGSLLTIVHLYLTVIFQLYVLRKHLQHPSSINNRLNHRHCPLLYNAVPDTPHPERKR